MKIVITAEEALEKGIWGDLCDLRDWNVYIINEGLMDAEETIELTEYEATSLGLIKKEE